MQKNPRKHNLIVIQGGPVEEPEGPATRLALWDRFPPVDKKHLTIMLLTKVALLIGMLYFIYG